MEEQQAEQQVEQEEVEQPAEQAAPEQEESSPAAEPQQQEEAASFDPLGDDVPDWLTQVDARGDGAVGPLTREEVDSLPAEAKRALYKMRRDALKAREGAAAEAKAAAEEKRKAEEERISVKSEQNGLYDLFRNNPDMKKLLETAKAVESGEFKFDPDDLSKDGIARIVQGLVAQQMQPLLEGLQKDAGQRAEAVWKQQRVRQIEKFADEHEDFRSLMPKIKEVQEETGLKAEDAYLLAKAKYGAPDSGKGSGKDRSVTDGVSRSRARAQAASSPGTGRSVTTDSLRGKSAMEKFRILSENPELREKMMREFNR